MTGPPRLVASNLKQRLLFFTIDNLCHHLFVLQSFGITHCYPRAYLALCFCTCCSLCPNALSAHFFLKNSYSSLKAQIKYCLFCESSSLQASVSFVLSSEMPLTPISCWSDLLQMDIPQAQRLDFIFICCPCSQCKDWRTQTRG